MLNILKIFKGRIERKARVERKTKETQISCILNLDGKGKTEIATGIGLLDHMLELFAFHGSFDLRLKASGDLKVDIHHTNEDVGIVLGQAFKRALGKMQGIARFGFGSVPMEDVVASVTVDISGRGFFKLVLPQMAYEQPIPQSGYELKDVRHFFDSLAKHLGINLIVKVEPVSRDLHTTLEPVFKALGLALKQATQIDPRRKGIPSTKGIID
jgi:imidazoleglycerol-phosphate dehydratase